MTRVVEGEGGGLAIRAGSFDKKFTDLREDAAIISGRLLASDIERNQTCYPYFSANEQRGDIDYQWNPLKVQLAAVAVRRTREPNFSNFP